MVLFVLSHVSYTMVDEVELLAVAYLRCTIFTPGVSNSVPPPPLVGQPEREGRIPVLLSFFKLREGTISRGALWRH